MTNSLIDIMIFVFAFFTDPSCVLIGNGCFLAELSCKGLVTCSLFCPMNKQNYIYLMKFKMRNFLGIQCIQ